VCGTAGRIVSADHGEMLIPSFTVHAGGAYWNGAIYGLRAGYGPELLMHCTHLHRTMRRAVTCAERELGWAREIVALAERQRAIAS